MTVNVLHFPDWRAGNYYFANLPAETQKQGVHPKFPSYTGRFFPLCVNSILTGSRVLHLHYLYPLTGVMAPRSVKTIFYQLLVKTDIFLLTRLLHVRLIWSVHNLITHDAVQPDADIQISRFTARYAHKLIAYGEEAKKQIIQTFRCPEDKIAIIQHGNYLQNYPNTISPKEAREILHISEEKKVYLFLGGMSQYKGVSDLIKAFIPFSQKNDLLLVAGNCKNHALKQEIKNLCQAQTAIQLKIDFIPDHDLQIYFNAADWVVLPFKKNLTSGSLILAMGFKKGLILSDSGLNREYADAAGTVYITQPVTPESIQLALEKSRQVDANMAGVNNWNKVQQFNWNEIAKKTITTYIEI